MLIFVNIMTDRQTRQKYSSEPHKEKKKEPQGVHVDDVVGVARKGECLEAGTADYVALGKVVGVGCGAVALADYVGAIRDGTK